ncbi:MAG: 2-amino-4-hydroxy-6-hydroxymethyldihydropteridinepyrophosphokinase [uncultured Truepera sp.]|uniref:2-amino-4-hydroxy-6-hydroxymethyldihydropteridine diphosphokinase n=1 Tax=uncultured Truepera sp. TaxID=543023 RepID=A0A6J4VR18_9DEIN|nr:MAG: 2-amino-4-hydroxy-6-hydroxymethyldihydropteridinepyrophosphokinase [uncultured Truepera sp.]
MARPLAHVALGSNLADPLLQLRRARQGLSELCELVSTSSLWRTAPVGGPPGQGDYLNAVVVLRPKADDPQRFLTELLGLEAAQGRVRNVRWDARTLDLDLLSWGTLVLQQPNLTLPHPRLLERAFVLAPLCEAAPGWRHPVSGEGACAALRALAADGIERTTLRWHEL